MIKTVGKSHHILFKRRTADSTAPTNFPRCTPPFEGGTRPARFLKPTSPKKANGTTFRVERRPWAMGGALGRRSLGERGWDLANAS